ncbi:MAG: hypothetical protein JWQ87_1796 [Candidatus Sulfotelmatobacter sp.]|nr:hypothetical protein [Candidatus Sulfotelmatobacter sp.]
MGPGFLSLDKVMFSSLRAGFNLVASPHGLRAFDKLSAGCAMHSFASSRLQWPTASDQSEITLESGIDRFSSIHHELGRSWKVFFCCAYPSRRLESI